MSNLRRYDRDGWGDDTRHVGVENLRYSGGCCCRYREDSIDTKPDSNLKGSANTLQDNYGNGN